MSPAPKDAKKDAKDSTPSTPAASITITIPSYKIDFSSPQAKFKLALLVMLVLVFLAGLYLFTNCNFAANDMFDVSRLQYNIPKLYSISFVAFIIVYSFALGLSMYYGFGTTRGQALLAAALLIVFSLIYGLLASPYMFAFLGFGAVLAAAAVLSCLAKDATVSSAWGVTSKALILLMVLAFVGVYLKVSANQTTYFNTFVTGLSNTAPQIVGAVLPGAEQAGQSQLASCATAIEGFNVTPAVVESLYPEANFSTAAAAAGGAALSSLPQAQQAQLEQGAYGACANMAATATNQVNQELGQQLASYNVSQAVGSVNANNIVTPQVIKQTINSVPALSQAEQLLPIISALAILSLISVFNFAVHILATAVYWMLTKLI